MISKLAIGTAQFGSIYGIANKTGKIKYSEAKEIIKFAKKNNIKTIDTASAYGESEKLLQSFQRLLTLLKILRIGSKKVLISH